MIESIPKRLRERNVGGCVPASVRACERSEGDLKKGPGVAGLTVSSPSCGQPAAVDASAAAGARLPARRRSAVRAVRRNTAGFATRGTKEMINPCLAYLHVISLGAEVLRRNTPGSTTRGTKEVINPWSLIY